MATPSLFSVTSLTKGSVIQQLQNGITMPKMALTALTLFPPTGILGLNWSVMGNMTVAFMKMASFAFVSLASLMLSQYSTLIPAYLISVLALVGPWYMFDVLQVLSKEFDQEGFILPLGIDSSAFPAGNGKGGEWKLTLPIASLILSTILASGLLITNIIPSGILSKEVQNYISYGTGGGSTIFATIGTVAGLTSGAAPVGGASPTTTVAPTKTVPSTTTVASTKTVPSTTTMDTTTMMNTTTMAPTRTMDTTTMMNTTTMDTTTMDTTTMAPTQTGGGLTLPPLSEFIDEMISQKSKSVEESVAFFSILAVIVLGGFMTTVFKR